VTKTREKKSLARDVGMTQQSGVTGADKCLKYETHLKEF